MLETGASGLAPFETSGLRSPITGIVCSPSQRGASVPLPCLLGAPGLAGFETWEDGAGPAESVERASAEVH